MALGAKHTAFAVVLAAVLGVLTFSGTEDLQSCAGCRNFRSISRRSVFGIMVYRSEQLDISKAIPAGHTHDWRRYSMQKTSVLGKSIGCRAHRFADDTDF